MKTVIYSKQILISLLKEWGQKNGKTPTRKLIDDDVSMPSSMAFRTHFGSWSNAILKAGYDRYIPIPVPKRKGTKNIKGVSIQRNKYGYFQIFEPTHPLSRKNGYVAIHRKNAFDSGMFEGIENPSFYDVHHLDENKENNDPSNLKIILKGEHTTLHTKGKKRPRKYSIKCLSCENICKSKYGLCTKCYKSQWSKSKNKSIYENPELLTK